MSFTYLRLEAIGFTVCPQSVGDGHTATPPVPCKKDGLPSCGECAQWTVCCQPPWDLPAVDRHLAGVMSLLGHRWLTVTGGESLVLSTGCGSLAVSPRSRLSCNVAKPSSSSLHCGSTSFSDQIYFLSQVWIPNKKCAPKLHLGIWFWKSELATHIKMLLRMGGGWEEDGLGVWD